jgi:hypothetical protein
MSRARFETHTSQITRQALLAKENLLIREDNIKMDFYGIGVCGLNSSHSG